MTPGQVKEAAAWLDLLNRFERAMGQVKQPDFTFLPVEVGTDPIRIPDVAGDPVTPPSRVYEALARHGLEVAR